jgi:acyl-CoA thioesterase FadM
MEFLYEVFQRGEGKLAASGRTVHAAIGANGRPCRLPDRIRSVFA